MEKSLSNFIKKTALFIALFLLPVFVLEVMLRQPEYDSYALKKYLMESTLSSNEVLIVGNSLSWGGLNPRILHENCINVAGYNQAFYSDYKILEKYLPKSQKLHTVILPVSAQSFFSTPDERSEQMYSAYWGLEPMSEEKTLEHYSVVTIFGFENSVRKLFGPKEIIADKGWGSSSNIYDENVEAAKNKLQQYRSKMSIEHFKTCTDYLDRIVDLCESHNIRLILYVPPFSSVYNRLLQDDIYQKEMMIFLEQYSRERSLESYDFNDNEIFPTQYFRDFNHLNRQGAERMSEMMKKILNQPPSIGMVKKAVLKSND
jgi:hypothetical protein